MYKPIKAVLAVLALSFSTAAFAETIDFASFDDQATDGSLLGGGKMREQLKKCMKSSWEATKPTADQSSAAKIQLDEVKTVIAKNKDLIAQDLAALKAAWMKDPILRDEVVASEKDLFKAIIPVHTAIRDAHITTLNLLTPDQRTVFNASFKECIKQQ